MSKSDSKNKAATNTGSKAETKSDSRAYQSMLGELDDIVRAVGQGQLDLDDVVGKIEHGYKLIATMRERLDATKARVEKLREDFEGSDSTSKPLHSKDKSSHDGDAEEDDDLPFLFLSDHNLVLENDSQLSYG